MSATPANSLPLLSLAREISPSILIRLSTIKWFAFEKKHIYI
jgi:hypothetical protein